MRKIYRSVVSEFIFQTKRNLARPTFVFVMFVNPLIFTLLLYFLVDTTNTDLLIQRVVAGAGLIGMWSTILFSAAADILREKEGGSFEYLVIVETDLKVIFLGKILVSASMSLLSLFQTYIYTSLLIGQLLTLNNPFWVLVVIVIMVYALVGLSLTIATLFTLSSSAREYQNLLEYPIYILSGIIFPVTLLPTVIQPFSYILPTTWGAISLRHSLGTTIDTIIICKELFVLFLLGTIFMILGLYLFKVIEKKARIDGTLGGL